MYLSPLRSVVARDLTWPAMIADGAQWGAMSQRPAITSRHVAWAIGVSLAAHLAAAVFVLTRHDAAVAPPAPTEISVDLVMSPSPPAVPQIVPPSPPADLAPAAAPEPAAATPPPPAIVPAPPAPAAPIAPRIASPVARPAPQSLPPAPPPRPVTNHTAPQRPAAQQPAQPAAAAPSAAPVQEVARPAVTVPPRPVAGMSTAQPVYPALALRRHDEGRVILRVQVSPEGLPVAVIVLAGSGNASLDEAATAAVRQWRFTPATSNGVPVAATADVPIEFRIAH